MIANVGWDTNSYLLQYATRLDGTAYVVNIKMEAEKMQQPLTALVVLAIMISAYAAIEDVLDPNPLNADPPDIAVLEDGIQGYSRQPRLWYGEQSHTTMTQNLELYAAELVHESRRFIACTALMPEEDRSRIRDFDDKFRFAMGMQSERMQQRLRDFPLVRATVEEQTELLACSGRIQASNRHRNEGIRKGQLRDIK